MKKLFEELVPRLEGRANGFTRIKYLGRRKNDAAELC